MLSVGLSRGASDEISWFLHESPDIFAMASGLFAQKEFCCEISFRP